MDYSDPKLWFSTEGRVNRRPYFFAGLAVAALVKASELVPERLLLFYVPVLLVAVYASVALGIKRCHDRDRTGWFILVNFVPLLCLWPIVELTFLKGTAGPNRFGADPLGGGTPAAAPAAPPAA
ncbi:MAG: DUF805 domain-containing protein [Elusimicrobia bacterium]|nr:DUF805 domain-containing protein [Elusimicrobiota bacterium]